MKKSASLLASLTLLAAMAACDKAPSPSAEAPEKNETISAAKTSAPAKATQGVSKVESAGNFLAEAAGQYTIDTGHTQLVFSVNHMGKSNQYGQFTKVEGSFSIDAKDLAQSEISLKVPTASIFSASKKRDDHLRSPDFFDAKQFPTITFKSTVVKATGGNALSVLGDLTMHGITKNVAVSLTHGGSGADPEMMGGQFRTGFNGTLTIKRSDFGMNYMPGGLGEEVHLLLALEGTRNK